MHSGVKFDISELKSNVHKLIVTNLWPWSTALANWSLIFKLDLYLQDLYVAYTKYDD